MENRTGKTFEPTIGDIIKAKDVFADCSVRLCDTTYDDSYNIYILQAPTGKFFFVNVRPDPVGDSFEVVGVGDRKGTSISSTVRNAKDSLRRMQKYGFGFRKVSANTLCQAVQSLKDAIQRSKLSVADHKSPAPVMPPCPSTEPPAKPPVATAPLPPDPPKESDASTRKSVKRVFYPVRIDGVAGMALELGDSHLLLNGRVYSMRDPRVKSLSVVPFGTTDCPHKRFLGYSGDTNKFWTIDMLIANEKDLKAYAADLVIIGDSGEILPFGYFAD